jgi:hypothetical protein
MKLWQQALITILPAVVAPWGVLLATEGPLKWSGIGVAAVASAVAGCSATKAFFSTEWAASPTSGFTKAAS